MTPPSFVVRTLCVCSLSAPHPLSPNAQLFPQLISGAEFVYPPTTYACADCIMSCTIAGTCFGNVHLWSAPAPALSFDTASSIDKGSLSYDLAPSRYRNSALARFDSQIQIIMAARDENEALQDLRYQCKKFRICIIGKAGVGKSTLLSRVFGVSAKEVRSITALYHLLTYVGWC